MPCLSTRLRLLGLAGLLMLALGPLGQACAQTPAAAPAAEAYVPALQFAQAVPVKEAAEPAGHCWHAVAPALEETFPDAHAVQPVEEEASAPEGHRAQLLLPLAPE